MDVYAWLAYRAPNTKEPAHIPWTALSLQFGHAYKRPRAFREAFRKAIGQVLQHYPVRVDETDTGIVVHPHAPDIPRLYKAAPVESDKADSDSDLAHVLDDTTPKGHG